MVQLSLEKMYGLLLHYLWLSCQILVGEVGAGSGEWGVGSGKNYHHFVFQDAIFNSFLMYPQYLTLPKSGKVIAGARQHQ